MSPIKLLGHKNCSNQRYESRLFRFGGLGDRATERRLTEPRIMDGEKLKGE
jgi:hypothetical protein